MMTEAVTLYLPWLLSVITVVATLLAGNKHRHAWALSLFNQGLWLLWIVTTHTWGFLPMNLVIAAASARNHWLWTRGPRVYRYRRHHDYDSY